MKTIKIFFAAALVLVGMSVSAQWNASTGSTANTDFLGFNYATNPDLSRPLTGLAVGVESFFGARVNCAANLKAYTNNQKWALGWGAYLGANMEFYANNHASTPGVLSFSFGGGNGLGYTRFRQSDGAGGYLSCMYIGSDGNIGVGTETPGTKLDVDGVVTCTSVVSSGEVACTNISANGKITTKEVEVTLTAFPDYVFDESYVLMPLPEVEKFINENNHLPGVKPAKEVIENGLSLGEMNVKLMEKVEELTLYVIDLQKQVNLLKGTEK